MKTIGVLGLGIIGGVWARHYEAAGVLAATWNRTPQPAAPRPVADPADVAAAADVVQLVLADPPAVRATLARMRPALRSGSIVVQSSTIDPASSAEFRALVTGAGARYVEAPFTGSRPAAEERKNVFFLGGDPAELDEVEPLLALVSELRLRIGTPAQAATLKVALNLNVAAQMQALAEALTLARRAGIGDDLFFSVLARNAGYSGLTKLKEPKLRAGDFTPQFSVKHLLKDMRLAIRTDGGPELPLLAALESQLQRAVEHGLGEEDFSAIVKLLPRS